MNTRFRPGFIYLWILGLFIVSASIPGVAAIAANQRTQYPAHTSARKTCQPGWVYDDITILGYPLVQLSPPYENVNDTESVVTSTFTEASSDTVAVVTSRGLLVVTSVILGAVTFSTSKAVVHSITTTSGNTVSFIVPAHKVAHAEYGVYEVEARGHYYYRDQFCATPFLLDWGEITSWCPWYAGWHTWVTSLGEESAPGEKSGTQNATNSAPKGTNSVPPGKIPVPPGKGV